MSTLTHPRWLRAADARLDDLRAVLDQRTDPAACPNAAHLLHDVPVYDCAALRSRLREDDAFRQALLSEWADMWADGPGILVLQGALAAAVVDEVTACFRQIIDRERDGGSRGDHFAKAGANDRVWNALEKLCLLDPAAFARYYANDMLALASEAWLGPAYQMTSQVNNVRPGGVAQTPHRDYHLGFCSAEQAQRYPAHVHRLSPALTLQGAVAHVDMPLESGPTLYLPHSQKYSHGYLIAERDEFLRLFAEQRVQLPLSKGDAVFFNPALLHAAGDNRSHDIQRMANLLQVSSAFGRACSIRSCWRWGATARWTLPSRHAPSRRAPRATRFPPTSTAIRRSAAWRRRARRPSRFGRCGKAGRPSGCRPGWTRRGASG